MGDSPDPATVALAIRIAGAPAAAFRVVCLHSEYRSNQGRAAAKVPLPISVS